MISEGSIAVIRREYNAGQPVTSDLRPGGIKRLREELEAAEYGLEMGEWREMDAATMDAALRLLRERAQEMQEQQLTYLERRARKGFHTKNDERYIGYQALLGQIIGLLDMTIEELESIRKEDADADADAEGEDAEEDGTTATRRERAR
jgi:hypothetical protein